MMRIHLGKPFWIFVLRNNKRPLKAVYSYFPEHSIVYVVGLY